MKKLLKSCTIEELRKYLNKNFTQWKIITVNPHFMTLKVVMKECEIPVEVTWQWATTQLEIGE